MQDDFKCRFCGKDINFAQDLSLLQIGMCYHYPYHGESSHKIYRYNDGYKEVIKFDYCSEIHIIYVYNRFSSKKTEMIKLTKMGEEKICDLTFPLDFFKIDAYGDFVNKIKTYALLA